MGPGDSVTALMDDRIWLWNDPIHDADFFMPCVSVALATRVVSSLILMTTWPVLGAVSSNLVHAKSRDDWSVAILSGLTVISSHTYLRTKRSINYGVSFGFFFFIEILLNKYDNFFFGCWINGVSSVFLIFLA